MYLAEPPVLRADGIWLSILDSFHLFTKPHALSGLPAALGLGVEPSCNTGGHPCLLPTVHLSQSGLLRATVSDGKVEHAFALPDSASRRPRWKTAARDDPASVLAESCRDTPTWQLQAPSAGGSWVRASQHWAEALELTDTRHFDQKL